jgi:Lon protease-like protein
MIHIRIRVDGRWRNAQPFRTARHGWIIDGLHVNAMLIKQGITELLAESRIAHHHWDDVAEVIKMRHANSVQALPKRRRALMQAFPFKIALTQMAYRSAGTCCNRWRQRR